MGVKCPICETRRPRRYCPAVRNDICSVCCGTSRETTLDCPLDCTFLQEAHQHERPAERNPEAMPHKDVQITEQFIEEHGPLFAFICRGLVRIVQSSAGLVDADVREALDAMARTYRTMQSGLVYETRPSSLIAAGIQQKLSAELDDLRKQLRERAGIETLRDADVLGVLVMLQRMEFARNNGRPRSKAFLDFLLQQFPVADSRQGGTSPGLIVSA